MSLTYLFLFVAGIVLGLALGYLEKKEKGFKNVSKQVISTLFLVSILIIIIGFTIAHATVVHIGIYIFIPVLAIFLVRKTFIYAETKN
ncbi:hypothetical protein [Aquibacillus rhizosphaerae]|uniref:Uncharacterized protein n=1 Tax=Aquibacillus rhizosphaerae TaxID=3051431 RepID=A0ABT7L2U5_9BACI|nr:hypothetical protein [Aquibacillus sp. LR5S19]MDL4840194.1 hypothetical protein [Aquibacillus sp. LR5S19]